MICWYCKSLIADDASACPCCGVAVVNPDRVLPEYTAYDEFRQNGFFNPYEEYYRNFQLPQMNPSFYGQLSAGLGGFQMPQFPAAAMALPMQNPFAPYRIIGVIYPQQQYAEDENEEVKPEIEDIVKDEPVLLLDQSEVESNYAIGAEQNVKEPEPAVRQTDSAKKSVEAARQSEPVKEKGKTNILAILGFVFAFIVPLIGLILSSVGLSKAKTRNLGGKGLAIAGIVISIVTAIAYAALIFIFSESLFLLLGL